MSRALVTSRQAVELRARFATDEVVTSLAILGMDRPPTQMSSKNNR